MASCVVAYADGSVQVVESVDREAWFCATPVESTNMLQMTFDGVKLGVLQESAIKADYRLTGLGVLEYWAATEGVLSVLVNGVQVWPMA